MGRLDDRHLDDSHLDDKCQNRGKFVSSGAACGLGMDSPWQYQLLVAIRSRGRIADNLGAEQKPAHPSNIGRNVPMLSAQVPRQHPQMTMRPDVPGSMQRRVQYAVLLQLAEHGTADG